jgi:PAS domain-containing protein
MSVQPDVVVVSGHMVDSPDRPKPRFPAEQVSRVAGEVQAALERWHVGPGTTLVTGGARGADIVAAEAARARGARLRLVLALEPDEFVSRSVALPGTDWEQRFRALLGEADVEVGDGPDDDTLFARTNDRIIEVARELDERPHAVIVWNGEEGDGPGGTGDFVARLAPVAGDGHVVVIDPMSPARRHD